ncbi:MAG: tyrosine recombinase [Clostridiales bacterium]|nr:tyrosine recombinase [Clostridiales bacterium]
MTRDYCLEFHQYLIHKKSVSKNTLDSYLHDITIYLSYLEQQNIIPINTTTNTIERYIKELIRRKRSKATITRNLASLRCFYQYLIEINEIKYNPAKEIKLEKPQKKLPHILTGKEMELLLSQPNVLEAKGCRDRAMMELLYATGIRASELVELNVQDINLNTGILLCHNHKTKRFIPIYRTAIVAVSDYIQRVRNQMIFPKNGEEQALFINLNGKRLTRQGFWKIIKSYAEQAHILKEITPHTMRHSFALHLLENGAELKDIQVMMGHADISSTQIYLKLLNQHLKETYHNCHPRSNQEESK